MAASGGETLTTVIAVVGCGLLIYNTVAARLDKRPKVNLRVSFGMVGLGPSLSEEKVFFEISNGGSQPVKIVSLYVMLPNRYKAIVRPEGPSDLPVSISPNTSECFWMGYEYTYDLLVKEGLGAKPRLRAYVTDALGKDHHSESVEMVPIRG